MPYSHLKILRGMDGAPLPQFLDDDGELRVMDRETLQEMIMTNIPELQKVSDEDVLALLDQILTKQGTGTQTVSGTVDVGNIPITDAQVLAELKKLVARLDLDINVGNLPTVQKVTVENQPVPVDIQKVKDADVNTRLLAIEQTNAAVVQSNAAILTKLNGVLDTQVTGSKVALSTDPKPTGVNGETLLEYNVTTKETKVYKFISGDWREL